MNASTQMPRYIDGVSMGASIVGEWINCRGLSNLGFQILWTGSAVGTWAADVSYDGPTKNSAGREIPSGNMTPSPVTMTAAMIAQNPNNANGNTEFQFRGMSCPWFRLKYTRTSGTGTLKVAFCGKSF